MLGWDWGPVMMTVGPWRPIHLDTYTYRFEDVRIDTDLIGPEYVHGTLKAAIQLQSTDIPSDLKVHALLRHPNGSAIKQEILNHGDDIDWRFDKGKIEGWYPINYGKQSLYKLELDLVDSVSQD
jgi:beta-mannosidase